VQWLMPVIIPATWKAKIGMVRVRGQPRQKLMRPPSQPVKAGCNRVCLSSQLHRSINRVVVQAGSSIKRDPLRKIKQKTGDMAQVVDHLPGKQKAMSSAKKINKASRL
jgi:hypothetical protein